MRTHHTVAVQRVMMVLGGVRHQGWDVDALLIRAGIAPALLRSPLARVSQGQYAALLRLLRRVTRDELWGLTSRPVRPGIFGQCMSLAVRCATLAEALRTGLSFYRLQLPDLRPRLLINGATAHLRIEPTRAADARLEEASRAFLLFTFTSASWLVGRRIPVRAVDYVVIGGPDTSRVYQAPVRHGQRFAGLAFDAQCLALPVVQTPGSLRNFLASAPESLIVAYRDPGRLSDRVRHLLARRTGQDFPTLEEVAGCLAVTPQTLRRRLREEGRGYQRIKDEIRRDASIEYLLRSRLSLPDIAARLGFSEAATFHRAFKGWTGVAPGRYRLAHCPATRRS